MVYNFFDKKSEGSGARHVKAAKLNQELTDELYKLNTRKFKNRKILSSFVDNM